MVNIARMSPPDSIGAALLPIASLSETEFHILNDEISGRRSFALPPKKVKDLVRDVPTIGANITFTLGALSFLYNRLETYRDAVPIAEVVNQIIAEIDNISDEQRQTLQQRLGVLLTENESYEDFKRTESLERGFLPNAVSFKSLVDLRPDFGGVEDDLEFNGFLKTVQFRIRTDSDLPNIREFVFQLSEEALDEMQQALGRARAKLEAIEDMTALDGLLLDREK